MNTDSQYQHLTEADIVAARATDRRARDVLREVSQATGIRITDLTGYSRRRSIVWPRQVAYLALHRAGYSLSDIGRIMHRDHTTVMHGIAVAKRRGAEA